MKRVDLEAAPHDVRAFMESLPTDSDGVELAIHGEVIWRLVRPGSLTDFEKQILVERGREIVREVRQRVRDEAPSTVQNTINEAVEEVRRRSRS